MKHSIIGTAGHVDHGKTLLIKALTGIDTDRLKEEQKRGITIDLGFAWLDLPDGVKAGIVDVPGHEKFINNMLAGAGGIDLVLLIVAADEGVMPQTREHLDILRLLDIPKGIVVVTKKDLVDPEWLDLVQEDIRTACKGTFLENAPLLTVSAYTGEGISELRDLIYETLASLSGKRSDLPFRQPIDRVFTMEGFGTVITGTIIAGQVKVGDKVMLYPDQSEVRVRNIQIHGEDSKIGLAGQRAAINLAAIARDEVLRGEVLASPNSLISTDKLDVRIDVLPSSPYIIKTGSKLHLHIGSKETIARIRLFESGDLKAGESGYARLNLDDKVAVDYGDRFILRFFSPLHTVGGGLVLDPAPLTARINASEWADRMGQLDEGDPKQRLLLAIDSGSPFFAKLPMALIRSGLNRLQEDERKKAVERLEQGQLIYLLRDQVVISSDFLADISKIALRTLDRYHTDNPLSPGIKREELRTRVLPETKIEYSDSMLTLMLEQKMLVEKEGIISLPNFTIKMTSAQQDAEQDLLRIYFDQGFSPEDTKVILDRFDKKLDPESLLLGLINKGELHRLTAQIVMHRKHIERAEEIVLSVLKAKGELKLSDFRDTIATSRKYAVAILDYFDRMNLTRLRGDVRILVKEDQAK